MDIFISSILLVTQMTLQVCLQPNQFFLEEEQAYFQTESKGVSQTEFELVGGLIFIEAELNGKKEKFILDTGSPHLMLNAKKENSKKSGMTLHSVGGSKGIYKKKGVDFDWNGINVKHQKTYSVDLQNIAKVKNKDFAGLVGYDQMRGKELVIDYEKKKVFLVSRKNKAFFANHKKVEKVWFRMVGHIPVVKVKIGKKRFYFGIDTGAEINVIDKRLKRKIPKELIGVDFESAVLGSNDEKMPVSAMQIKSVKVGKSYYEDMPFAFTDLSFLTNEEGFTIDGLLGYHFLKQANFSINYRKKQLCKWELKTKDNEPIQLAVSKKKIKITKPLFYHN